MLFGASTVVEHGYIRDIVEGAVADVPASAAMAAIEAVEYFLRFAFAQRA